MGVADCRCSRFDSKHFLYFLPAVDEISIRHLVWRYADMTLRDIFRSGRPGEGRGWVQRHKSRPR